MKPKDVLMGPRIPISFKKNPAVQIKSKQAKVRDQGRKAVVSKNREGFYEVNVEYSHLSALGSGCGLNADEVIQALHADNNQRKIEYLASMQDTSTDPEKEGPDVSYEPGSSEELEMEEEVDLEQL